MSVALDGDTPLRCATVLEDHGKIFGILGIILEGECLWGWMLSADACGFLGFVLEGEGCPTFV